MIQVGITGNMGSGKSTVARIFSQLGVPVYDADIRAKAVMTEYPELVNAIKALLGNEAYSETGVLNRSFISQKVFHDSALLKQLNALVHPVVFKDFDQWVLQQDAAYVLKEAALLVESKSYQKLDFMILVQADEELRIRRCMDRDGSSEEDIRSRMKNQMPQEEKALLAHFFIHNNGELLIPQVMQIHRTLLSK